MATLLSLDATSRCDATGKAVFIGFNETCSLSAVNDLPDATDVIGYQMTEYHLNFTAYKANPLLTNMTHNYKSNVWYQVTSRHGQTLLALPHNYEFLSLTFLTIGVRYVNIELEDEPAGCFGKLSEAGKIQLILKSLVDNFQTSPITPLRMRAIDDGTKSVTRS